MGRWRRQQGGIYHQDAQGARSQNRKPPGDAWQLSVPSWEKKFCTSIGSVPWRKLVETKKCMYLYDSVVQWNDSAVEEAFHNAKSRFWAEINGLPCDISLPDPDIYIDEVDWNSTIDPELLLDLEWESEAHGDADKDEKTLIFGDSLPLNEAIPCTGWGDAEEDLRKVTDLPWHPGYENFDHNVDGHNSWEDDHGQKATDLPWHPVYENCDHNVDNHNSWENNRDQSNGAMKDNGWGNYQNDSWGLNQWKNGCNEWENNYKVLDNIDGGREGAYWGMWDGNNRKKEGSDRYMSRYKTSRFHGNDYQMGHGWRNGRGRRVTFAYE